MGRFNRYITKSQNTGNIPLVDGEEHTQLDQQCELALTNQNLQIKTKTDPQPERQYFPIEIVIRGNYKLDWIKYVIKWQGHLKKHNTWEKECDLKVATLKWLKLRPVRIFGKKPHSPMKTLLKDLTNLVQDPVNTDITKRDQEPSDVNSDNEDTDTDSDNESIC